MNNQEKVANSLGIEFERVQLDLSTTEEALIEKIVELNNRIDVSGIILQLPLPKTMDEKKVISAISPIKDIDCLTYENQGKLYMGEKGYLPCTPSSVVTILENLSLDLEGKEVVVLGRSNIVGKPVAALMLEKNCTVTICHSKTKNLKEVCKRADILIVAIGRPRYIDSTYIKDGAVVIDVGTSSLNGKITGDVNLEDAINTTSYITSVPGGVGAITTTLLMKNACEAMKNYET
jgi:methylenetetrahydrofolate dehydrogenase (NADP+)/methenyltetrahydrofolate cyclohydrolase